MLYNWNKLFTSVENVTNQIYVILYVEEIEVYHNTRDLGSKHPVISSVTP